MTSWHDSFQFDVLPRHVAPFTPKLGAEVRLVVLLSLPEADAELFVRWVEAGERCHARMERIDRERDRTALACQLPLRQAATRLHFLARHGSELSFFSRTGCSSTPPPQADEYLLLNDFDAAYWVCRGPMYHIVPDRFARGSNQAQLPSAEGAVVMRWGDAPLSFEQGRCRDFYLGDLAGIASRVGHLQEIGVRSLCLTPIFSAKSTHRYDTLDYTRVDPLLGGNEALRELSNSLHRAGLRLVLDVATNHTSADHPWFKKALGDPDATERELYCFDATKPQGYLAWSGLPEYPKLNYASAATRDRMYRGDDSPLKSFLQEPYGVDGWRFDAAHQTGNTGAGQLGQEVFRELRTQLKRVRPDVYLVGECGIDASPHLQGDEWDAATNYWGSARPLRWFVGEVDFFMRPYIGSRSCRATTGRELARQLELSWQAVPTQLLLTQYNFIDCHDAPRFHNTPRFTLGRMRVLLTLLYLLPGVPVVYYGSELGIRGGVDAPEDFRHPMPWDEQSWSSELLELYAALGRLRSSQPALQVGAYRILHADEVTIALSRFDGDRAYVALASNSLRPERRRIDLGPIGVSKSQPRTVVGSAEVTNMPGHVEVCVPAEDAVLLELVLEP